MLLECMDIQVSSDSPDIHPPKFCNNCYAVMTKTMKSILECTVVRSSLQPFLYKQHSEGSCSVCNHFNIRGKGGEGMQTEKHQ